MALSYSEIRDLYDPIKDSGATAEDLPTWSARMNELTGTNLYDAGVNDNWIKRASHGIDKLLEATGAPQATEEFGRQVGGLIGAPEAGAEIGHGLPRSVINFAPLLIPGAGGAIGAGLRLGLTGALSGAETYEKSGSPLAGVLSGATAAALPGITSYTTRSTGQLLGKLVGSKLVEGPLSDLEGNVIKQISEYIPETFSQKLIQKGGSELAGQVAAAGAMGVAQPLEQLAQGEEPTSPFTKENLLGLTLGQLPFAALHLGKRALSGEKAPTADDLQRTLDLSKARIELKAAKDNIANRTGLENLPDVEQPAVEDLTPAQYETARQTRQILSDVRKQQITVKNDPNLTDEQKVEQLNTLMNREYALQRERAEQELGDTILGNGILPDAPRTDIIGEQLRINKNGTWRAVRVADDPFNPEELRGKIIGYSTKDEPPPQFGLQSEPSKPYGGTARFSLPDSQWWTVKTPEEWAARYPVKVRPEQTPELPVQAEPLTDEQLSAHLHELENVYQDVEAADTPADIQSAVVKLNSIEASNDLPTTNDTTIKKSVSQLVDAGYNPDSAVKAAVKARTRRVAREVKANAKANRTPEQKLLDAGFDQETIDSMDAEQRADALQSVRDLERAAPLPTPEEYSKIAESFGGEGGFSVITADKLSHRENTIEDQPVKDLVTDTAIEAARTPQARDAFTKWFGEDNAAQYAEDFGNFMELTREYGLKDIDPEGAAKLLNAREGVNTWDADEVKEFLSRPHVQEWTKGVEQRLAQMQQVNAAPVPPLYNVAGRKGSLLQNEDVAKVVENFSRGKDVVDAFGGGGNLTEWAIGAGATRVTTNIKNPKMFAIWNEVKNNTEDFANRVQKAVEPITSTREQSTPTVEGYDNIRTYLDELEKTDPNVALYIKQNLNAMGREVAGSSFTPSKVMATEGLRSLPSRVRSYGRLVGDITSQDGWELVGNAKEGDNILVDPPYSGTKKGMYADTGNVTTEDQLQNYEKYLYPAAARGAKFVVFDVADPKLIESLKAHGFTVDEVSRTSRGGARVQPELIATNSLDAVNVPLSERAPRSQVNAMPEPNRIVRPAGNKFLFSMAPYDPATNRLGGKHTLPRDSVVPEDTFVKIGGVGAPLKKAEVELYKQIVPEAFTDKGVNVKLLDEGLKKSGPVVETKVLGLDQQRDTMEQERGQARHNVETVWPEFRQVRDSILADGQRHPNLEREWLDEAPNRQAYQALRNYIDVEMRYQLGEEPTTYNFVAPKSPGEMPGYVEGLVRLPLQAAEKVKQEQPNRITQIEQEAEYLGYRLEPPSVMDDQVLVYKRGSDEPIDYEEQPKDIQDLANEYAEITINQGERKNYQQGVGHKNILYRGPHFGGEDTNVLAFFRGYVETLPNGEKAFHVIEVQSDWGQTQRERQEYMKRFPVIKSASELPEGWKWRDFGEKGLAFNLVNKYGETLAAGRSKEEALQHYHEQTRDAAQGPTHPLLSVYNELALKAAIQHAKEIGATKVILSDAETAMMTEGHDSANTFEPWHVTLPEPHGGYSNERPYSFSSAREQEARDFAKAHNGILEYVGNQVPQEKGMRLNYDQKLPSAMEKLTGGKGTVVDLGPHKSTQLFTGPNQMERVPLPDAFLEDLNAREARGELAPGEYDRLIKEEHEKTKGSPVFRTPEGQPKTQITGRMYDISNVPSELTLTEPNRAPLGERAPRSKAPLWTPTEQVDKDTMQRMGIGQGGQGMVNFLLQSKNPLFAAIGRDLSKFTDSLARVSSNIRDMDFGAYNQSRAGGRFEISLSPAILRADDFTKEYAVAHELVHSLSLAELQNPTKQPIVDAINDLRERVIDKLPKPMKDAIQTAIDSDWYRKWAEGQTTMESLMPKGTSAQRDILYGLLDNNEFVAQGLSAHAFREHLQSVKFGNETWFSRFTNLIKELIGLGNQVDNTAFGEFLSKTDQLLERSNNVASFRNFAGRYFENLGQSTSEVNSNTQRAMGLLLTQVPPASPEEALLLLRQGAGGFRSNDWSRAQRDVVKMFNERGDDAAVTQSVLDETGHTPNHSGLLDMADSLMTGQLDPRALDLLPEPAARYIFETAKDAQNIFGVIKAATKERNTGVLNISDPTTLRTIAQSTLRGIDRVMEQNRLHDMQVRQIQDLFSVPPDGFFQNKIVAAPKPLPEDFSGEKPEVTRGIISRFLEPPAQIAARIPESAEAFAKGYQLRANVRNMAREALKALGMDLSTRTLNSKTVKGMFKTFQNASLRKAADRWIAENNIQGEKSGEIKVLDADDPRIQSIIGHLNPADRETVEDMVNKHSISTQFMQNQMLEKGLQIASTNGGALVQKLTGMKLRDSVELAGRLLNAFTADRSDANATSVADAEIQFIRNKLDADQFLTIARFIKSAADSWQSQKEFFQQNPAWSTAKRYGKFLIEFRKGNQTILDAVNNRKEAEQRAEGRPFKLTPNRQYDEDRPPSLGFDAPGIAERLRGYEQTQMDILKNSGVFDDEQLALMRKYSPSEQFITEQTYRSGVKNLQPEPRRLSKGAEELSWLRNHVSWVHDTANYWSRQLLRAQARAHLMDPEIAQNPQLQSDLKTHYENMLQPDTAVGRFMQRAAMTWFMGYNPASALINATQPFLTHVAEMTAMTGKPLESYRRTLSALKEVYASGLGHLEWKDPVTREFMKRFIKDGEADVSMFDDEAAGQELLHTNLVRMLNGEKPQTLGQKLSTMAGNISTTGMWMFKTVERINAMAAGISAYKYFRESQPNLSPNEAYEKAVQFHHTVNYGGGAAARPVGAFSGRGAFPRTVAMLATAMQSYNLGTIFQLARYIRSGFFRPAGLTPAEIHSARTAAVQMLGTQLAAAGVLGLPFVSGMLAALNSAFPGLELNKKVREAMNGLLGQDGENGHLLSDISMTGVPSMFGWDLQSRLSMGNTLPGVSEINGFQPENLFGAPANLVSNFVNGGLKLAAGDPHAIDSFMPSALKKIEQLLRSGGQVLDYRNRPIFTPTIGEKVGIALGFNPKRLSDFNAASRIAAQTDDNIKRREGQFHADMANEVLKGNFGTVRQNLLQRSREDKTYDPVAAVHSIAGAAEELTFPRDLRREGTLRASDSRSKLLATFNLPPTQPTEVDRLRFRQSVQQRLGLSTQSPTDLQTATLVDQLRTQNPEASRAELRRQATLLLRGRRLGRLSLTE